MNVLVGYATKHGSTQGIAEVIADELKRLQIDAIPLPINESMRLADFSAAILGSAVYMGKWMGEAQAFAQKHSAELQRMPVWLFSSGPVGKIDIGPMIDERMISDIVLATGAREHQMFAGKLDPDNLRLHQKIALKVVRAPTGDFRDWEAIRNWVHSIAGQLAPPVLEVAS